MRDACRILLMTPPPDDRPLFALWFTRLCRRVSLAALVTSTLTLVTLASIHGLSPAGLACSSDRPCSITDKSPPSPSLPGLPNIAAEPDPPLSLLSADRARALNKAVPFVKGPVPVAAPFHFGGDAQDRIRARECLATAMLYEAGTGSQGQQAVAQVVLNRVRHPAFPKTVCGVVYQGSERTTGCQFTFSCDGSLTRIQPRSWMESARKRADEALAGRVFAQVGLATHYHTDWVYPYWSSSLDKVAVVSTHLFFRWPGFWGTRAAFGKRYGGGEPLPGPTPAISALREVAEKGAADVSALNAMTPEHISLPDLPPPSGIPAAALRGNVLKLVHPQGGAYVLVLRAGMKAEDHLGVALRLCQDQKICHVMGWAAGDALPRSFPVPGATRESMRFSYFRDRQSGREEVRFDCVLFTLRHSQQCLEKNTAGLPKSPS